MFDPKQKFYFQDPGRIGQAVSDDEDDPLLDTEPVLGEDADAEPEQIQSANQGSGIRDLVDTAQDYQDKYQELRDRIKRGEGNPFAKKQGPGTSPNGPTKSPLSEPANDGLRAGKNAVRQASTKGAQQAGKAGAKAAGKAGAQAAGKAAASGAARAAVGAGGMAAVEAAGAAAGPVGWIIDAVLIGGQLLYAFSKTKLFRWMLAGFFFVAACFMLLLAAGNKAILQSGLNGASEVIKTFATNAFLPLTAAQSLITFVQNIDKITADIDKLIKENPALTAKQTEVNGLLGQLTSLRNEIEPTAGSGGQASAEQLQKYNDVILQLKKLFEGDREATAALVLAANEGGSLRLTETGCNTLKDIKNLSISNNAMKVILGAAEYGKSAGKTIRVTCLVSGHRKYVGKPPSQGYPYCGQPDNALSAGFSASRMSFHCSGRAIDFGGLDTGLGTYLNTHREELGIEDILFERDTNHIHVEVKP